MTVMGPPITVVTWVLAALGVGVSASIDDGLDIGTLAGSVDTSGKMVHSLCRVGHMRVGDSSSVGCGLPRNIGHGVVVTVKVEVSSGMGYEEEKSEVELEQNSGSPVGDSDITESIELMIVSSAMFPLVVLLSLEDMIVETSGTSEVGVGSWAEHVFVK